MEASWYRVKEREGRHGFMRMANDGLLGIKAMETQKRLRSELGYSSDEIGRLFTSARELKWSIIASKTCQGVSL